MNNLLVLRFDNAGLFFPKQFGKKGARDSGDRIFYTEFSGKKRKLRKELRQESQWDDIPSGQIGLNQIKNLLMVMCGYRPTPKFRAVDYQSQSDVIDAMARRCLVQVDNILDRYITETQIVRKAVDDTWNTSKTCILKMSWGDCTISGITLSWERIYQMIGRSVFDDFVEFANDLLDTDVLQMISSEVFEKISFINSPKKDTFLKRLEKEKGISPFKYLLVPSKSGTMEGAQAASCQGNKALLAPMVRYGVSKVARLSGSITLEVSDDQMKLFQQGSGTATLLDGGFVRIEKIVYGDEESFEPYLKGQLPYESV